MNFEPLLFDIITTLREKMEAWRLRSRAGMLVSPAVPVICHFSFWLTCAQEDLPAMFQTAYRRKDTGQYLSHSFLKRSYKPYQQTSVAICMTTTMFLRLRFVGSSFPHFSVTPYLHTFLSSVLCYYHLSYKVLRKKTSKRTVGMTVFVTHRLVLNKSYLLLDISG